MNIDCRQLKSRDAMAAQWGLMLLLPHPSPYLSLSVEKSSLVVEEQHFDWLDSLGDLGRGVGSVYTDQLRAGRLTDGRHHGYVSRPNGKGQR